MPLKVSEDLGEPTLNLTPMIDIVFLLIIFFMVGTQFAERERQLDVKLPTVSDAQPLTSRPDEIVVNVIDSEVVAVRSERLSLAELEATLREAKQNYPDQMVVVRGSGPNPYQHVMTVLEVCHRANISHIALANRLEEGP